MRFKEMRKGLTDLENCPVGLRVLFMLVTLFI